MKADNNVPQGEKHSSELNSNWPSKETLLTLVEAKKKPGHREDRRTVGYSVAYLDATYITSQSPAASFAFPTRDWSTAKL